MNAFIIVCNSIEQPPDFHNKVVSLADGGVVWHQLNNVWLINTWHDALSIRNSLIGFFGDSDHFLVLGLSGSAAWNTDTQDSSDLIKKLLLTEL